MWFFISAKSHSDKGPLSPWAEEGLFALRPMEKSLAKTFDLSAVLRLPEESKPGG